jgi:hypothetical protein
MRLHRLPGHQASGQAHCHARQQNAAKGNEK